VVLDGFPGDKQTVAARLLDRAPKLHAVATFGAPEDRRSLFHAAFELLLQAGFDVDLRDFGDHGGLLQ